MICFPNAKINIGLNITEKREDGFHNIETVMYPLKGILSDALEIIEAPPRPSPKGRESQAKIHTKGILIDGNSENNLCVKAYHLIKKDYPEVPDINIYLHKAIPIGAGLGGGSADAAFFIRLLNEKFELGLAWGEMHHYAKQLGSDCSFFVSNKPAFAEGKGDQLESVQLDLSRYYIALVCPEIHINTAQAYSGVKPKKPERSLEKDIQELPVAQWKKYIHNDFEDSVFPKYPEIKKIKEKLYTLGAVYASMSGSGSSVYGIFKKEPKAKKNFAKYSVWEGKTIMKKLFCGFLFCFSSILCLSQGTHGPLGSSVDLIYGTRLFTGGFYDQLNTLDSFSFKTPVQLIGMGVSGAVQVDGRYRVNYNHGHITYTQVVPQKLVINDTINCMISGYVFSLGYLGWDLFPESKTFHFAFGTGFNTGRLRLHDDSQINQKNPFFSPKIFIQPKVRIGPIYLSLRADCELDISSPNWRRTLSAAKGQISLQRFRETGLSAFVCVGFDIP